ncbi:oligosaccharide repeat unit polymerase [Chryseobacterium taeanense]|uniref:Oligosaccharide repeat unit polymerase n=1 Tax=Chryseobacterium taeanense TaxID=311334 RepID=A0A1G8ECG2_9FLAO|nr:oligosaccharide repeat unit polymerase [Chryseobacterium taeanense]SDH67558.1 oligosaccharide repeat unit polymerase [Chryseobacterium taeanense]
MNKLLWVFISIICIVAMFFAGSDSDYFSNRVFFTSSIIQVISIYNIFSRGNEPFSLEKMFYLFSLFFFGVAPLLQSFENSNFWYYRPLLEEEYFFTNILVIIIIILYKFVYLFFRRTIQRPKAEKKLNSFKVPDKITFINSLLLIALSLLAFFIVFASNDFNILPMLVRGGELVADVMSNVEADESPTKWLIVNNFVRPISIMCFLYYAVSKEKNKVIFTILGLLALMTCFPSAVPRFAAAAMYIPVILILFSFVRKKNVFSLIFVGGLLFLFPFLNIFRNFGDVNNEEFKLDFKMFTEAHFDSYQNFALLVSNEIITYGGQLLGVFLFWVPRSIWPEKPLGTGAFTAEKLNFFFSNVAANYFAEGYVNFGYLGIILFLLFLAYQTALVDKIYWESERKVSGDFFSVLYTISLGFLFFILRGDMLSSVAYMFGFLFAAVFVYKITTLKIKN